MWDTIIGNEYGFYGNAAVRVSLVYDFVSENGVSYWFHCREFNTGYIVEKACDQGKRIKKLITQGVSPEELKEYLMRLLLSHCPVQKILSGIEEAKKDAFQRGMEAKAEELKRVLYIYD